MTDKITRRQRVTLTFDAWRQVEIPDGTHRLAAQRTAYLAGRAHRMTPEAIAISAYLQGIEDCAQVFFRRGAELPGVTDVTT